MSLDYTGDTFLTVSTVRLPVSQVIYSFHTTNRSWLALAVIAGTIVGLVSVLAQAIVAIFG